MRLVADATTVRWTEAYRPLLAARINSITRMALFVSRAQSLPSSDIVVSLSHLVNRLITTSMPSRILEAPLPPRSRKRTNSIREATSPLTDTGAENDGACLVLWRAPLLTLCS